MRRYFIANWKMYMSLSDIDLFFQEFFPNWTQNEVLDPHQERAICIFAPSYPHLSTVLEYTAHVEGIDVAAQDCAVEEEGAFTGEVSAKQLAEMGVNAVILGHSERRKFHKETNDLINKKIQAALQHGLQVILCIGETKEERAAGQTASVLQKQLQEALVDIHLLQNSERVIVAYEPVWAIGTGVTPTNEEIVDAVRVIQDAAGQHIDVVYGGSVEPENAPHILAIDSIAGVLVGKSSTDAQDWTAIYAK